jgi:hypothetical protein
MELHLNGVVLSQTFNFVLDFRNDQTDHNAFSLSLDNVYDMNCFG